MREQGRGGAIVHTGSMWALQAIGATPSAAHSVANAGVHALVRNLAIELAGDRIRVNAVAPAVVETPVYETFMSPEQVAKTLPTFNALHPLGRNGQQAMSPRRFCFSPPSRLRGLPALFYQSTAVSLRVGHDRLPCENQPGRRSPA